MTEYRAHYPISIMPPVVPPLNDQTQTYQVAKKYKLVSMMELDIAMSWP